MTTEEICEKYNITNYTINPDGSIDVNENVNLFNRGLIELPLIFNKVSGYFDCSWNRLTSLKGCPRWVGSNFNCYNNKLPSLEFSPEYVGGNFDCNSSQLTSLKGSPRWVGSNFDCYNNQLPSLEFSPEYVGGNFACNSSQLTSLKGSPEYIGGDFEVMCNDLTDLVGSPKEVGGDFYCSDNENLINPKGCAEKIGRVFYCSYTPLSSIFNNVDQFFLHAFNFYKVIKDDTVNLKRLKYVMDLYDKPIDLEKIEKYYRLV